jgi:hypothetical protein
VDPETAVKTAVKSVPRERLYVVGELNEGTKKARVLDAPG